MKNLKYLSWVLAILILIIFNRYINFTIYYSHIVTLFFMFIIICSVVIATITLASFLKFQDFENLYFTLLYSIITFLSVAALVGLQDRNLISRYYFDIIKFSEIAMFFFGIFILNNIITDFKFYKYLIALIALNSIFILVLIRFSAFEILTLILYIEMYFLYHIITSKENIRAIKRTLNFKILSELLILLATIFTADRDIFNILGYIFYIYSLYLLMDFFFRDIFEKIKRNIYSLEKHYQLLSNKCLKGVMRISNYTIKSINPSFAKIFEIDNKKNIIGGNIFSIFDNLSKEQLDKIIESYPEEETLELSLHGLAKKLKILAYKSETGNNSEIIIILTNEFQSTGIFEKSLDAIDDIIYIYELDDGYKYMNQAIKSKLGYSIKDCMSEKSFKRTFLKNDELERHLNFVNEKNSKRTEIFTYKTINQKELTFKENVARIENDGKIYDVGIMTDITDLIKEKRKLKIENDKLKKHIFGEEKIFSMVSHEIRTPITAIIGFLENILINKRNLDERTLGIMQKIYRNSIRLKELVNNILDFNKLNVNKFVPYKEKIYIKILLEEIMLNNEILMDLRGIEQKNLVSDDVIIYADSNMCYQIFNNLVSNAIKYNREDGYIIVDSTTDKENVVVKISDTGPGIKNKLAENIFNEYEREEGLRQQGSGLGLSLVKRLVDINGGEIWFESKENVGTVFFVKLAKYKNGDIENES